MKTIFLITISSTLLFMTFGQDKSLKERTKFLHKFEHSVEQHKMNKVIALTEKSYRKEQIAFLDGRKEQFVDELFGGMDELSANYVNIKFRDITDLELVELIELKDGSFNCIFRIKDGEHQVLRSLFLTKVGRKYRLIGSRG